MQKQEWSKEYASRILHRSREAKEYTALMREQRIRLLSFIYSAVSTAGSKLPVLSDRQG